MRTRSLPRFGAFAVALGLATAGLAAPPSGAVPARPASSAAARAVVSGGWESTTPAAEGMDATVLAGARTYAFQADRHTQGVVVVRGGRIVDEWYAPGEGPDSWATSWSVGKSFASALVGIAIAQGKIANVDLPMSTWFPDWAGTAKGAITLQDVLHMESGLGWSEDYNPSDIASSGVIQMGLSADELSVPEAMSLAHPPGTVFNYSSGDAMLLSEVLARATGMPADQYAQEVLFGPLGMKQVEWWRDAAGHTLTYCCLDTTSRNYARFGLLFLRNGDWNGTQVVPASWVQASFTPTAHSGGEYGNMWWMFTLPNVQGLVYAAEGFDGQFIYVIPSLDLVVVRNGDYVKSACPAVADPNLFGKLPPLNLVPGAGSRPPASWDDGAFLGPIIDSITGPETGTAGTPTAEADPGTRDPSGQKMVACPASAPPSTPTTVAPPTTVAQPATAVPAAPTYTG